MSEFQKNLDAWKEQGEALSEQLRQRLKEVELERAELLTLLARVEGQAAAPAPTDKPNGQRKRKQQKLRSPLALTIQQILREAGPLGLQSGEIYESLVAEVGDSVRRDAVLTLLSRMKKRGQIRTEGTFGMSRYIAENER